LTDEKKFSLEELVRYDGRNGHRAYVAFNGKVYDVTDSPLWAEAVHFGTHQAGEDLTAEMDAAPHGPENLDNVNLVGVLLPIKN
jgi:predicted heme/steroid binding protein